MQTEVGCPLDRVVRSVPIEYCGSWFFTEVVAVGHGFAGSAVMHASPLWARCPLRQVRLPAAGVHSTPEAAEQAALLVAKESIDAVNED